MATQNTNTLTKVKASLIIKHYLFVCHLSNYLNLIFQTLSVLERTEGKQKVRTSASKYLLEYMYTYAEPNYLYTH